MWANVQYRILKRISPGSPDCCTGSAYEGKSKLAILLGDKLLAKIHGQTVIDFGCGEGAEAIEMAQRGAGRVVGIDIREDLLQRARQKAVSAGMDNVCLFASQLRSLQTLSFPLTALSTSRTRLEFYAL